MKQGQRLLDARCVGAIVVRVQGKSGLGSIGADGARVDHIALEGIRGQGGISKGLELGRLVAGIGANGAVVDVWR